MTKHPSKNWIFVGTRVDRTTTNIEQEEAFPINDDTNEPKLGNVLLFHPIYWMLANMSTLCQRCPNNPMAWIESICKSPNWYDTTPVDLRQNNPLGAQEWGLSNYPTGPYWNDSSSKNTDTMVARAPLWTRRSSRYQVLLRVTKSSDSSVVGRIILFANANSWFGEWTHRYRRLDHSVVLREKIYRKIPMPYSNSEIHMRILHSFSLHVVVTLRVLVLSSFFFEIQSRDGQCDVSVCVVSVS